MRISWSPAVLFGGDPRATAVRAGALIVAAVVVFGWILLPVRLSGISMLPAYADGELDFANRAAYWLRPPARGDVVAIRMAGPHVLYVKRIVGLPGERVAIAAGMVLIDGRPLVEPHVVRRRPWEMAPVDVGRDEYFVIGDNRSMAIENHDLGRVKRDRIIGKLLY
jgi:signal peptidase I